MTCDKLCKLIITCIESCQKEIPPYTPLLVQTFEARHQTAFSLFVECILFRVHVIHVLGRICLIIKTLDHVLYFLFYSHDTGTVVQKPINANYPRLKVNQGVHISSPKRY